MFKRFISHEKGQSLVEFALLLPLLLYLVCGIIDFGRIMYTQMQLNLTTQEAVRLGGLGRSDADIRQYTLDHVDHPTKVIVTITPSDSLRKSGDYVKVSLEEQMEYITPLMSTVLPSPYRVVTDSTIRVE
ncbi:MAG: TadE family protein [Paenibacillaceae bacterium]